MPLNARVPLSTDPRTAPKSVHATSLVAPAHAAALALPDKTARKNARHNMANTLLETERPRPENSYFITLLPIVSAMRIRRRRRQSIQCIAYLTKHWREDIFCVMA